MDRATTIRWRRVMAIDIGSFNMSIVSFAVLPLGTLTWAESAVAVVGVLITIGVVANSAQSFRLPLEHWSYLMSGAFSLMSALTYITMAHDKGLSAGYLMGPFFMMLAASASAYAAHIIDGALPINKVGRDAAEW